MHLQLPGRQSLGVPLRGREPSRILEADSATRMGQPEYPVVAQADGRNREWIICDT